MSKKVKLIPMEITRKEASAMGLDPTDVRPVKIGSRLVYGLLIPAESEEQYRGIIRDIWAEEKRVERSRRCTIPNGHGKTKRCEGHCNQCEQLKTGSTISLDYMKEENGKEISEPIAETSSTILTAMLFQDLMDILNNQDPTLAEIFSLLYDGESQRSIARITGINAQSTVQYRIRRIRHILQQYVSREDIIG